MNPSINSIYPGNPKPSDTTEWHNKHTIATISDPVVLKCLYLNIMFEKRNPTVGPAQLDQRSELCNDFCGGLAYAGLRRFGLALAYFLLHNYAETCLPPSLRLCIVCLFTGVLMLFFNTVRYDCALQNTCLLCMCHLPLEHVNECRWFLLCDWSKYSAVVFEVSGLFTT